MTIDCLVLHSFNGLFLWLGFAQAHLSHGYNYAVIPNTSELLSHPYLRTGANLPLCFIVNYKTIQLSSLGCCKLMITLLLSHKSLVQN